jgi:hypothetical protein
MPASSFDTLSLPCTPSEHSVYPIFALSASVPTVDTNIHSKYSSNESLPLRLVLMALNRKFVSMLFGGPIMPSMSLNLALWPGGGGGA